MQLSVNRRSVNAGTGGAAFDPKKPVILFIHGAGMDHTVWALQVRYFAHNGWATLALDLPGHGGSEGPPLSRIEAMADWVVAVLDAADCEKASIVGHSMGALAALATAAAHGDRVDRLALLGVTPAMTVNQALLDAAQSDPGTAIQFILSWGYGRRAQTGGMRAPGLWMMGGGQRLLERTADGVLHTDFAACNAYDQGPAAASAIKVPTLVLSGADDRMTPAGDARGLAETIADCRFEILPGAGHMMMIEQPDATLDALQAFLRAKA